MSDLTTSHISQSIESETLAVIILAAGCSSRLGQAKQLVNYQGQSLLYRQCQLALTFTDRVICVFGHQHQRMASNVSALPITSVVNHQWRQGLGSSIAKGISELTAQDKGVMLLLVDQWQLQLNDLLPHVKAWQQHPQHIIASKMGEKLGPPSVFPPALYTELSLLTGESGAKSLLQRFAPFVKTIELPKAFIDLDTPEQLAKLQACNVQE